MTLGRIGRLNFAAVFTLVFALALTGLGFGTVASAPAAFAQGSDKFIVTPNLTQTNTPLQVGDKVNIDFTWEVKPGAEVAVGDIIEMEFNADSAVVFTRNPPTFNLLTPSGQVAANCIATATKITCTFVESDIIGPGIENIEGTASAEGHTIKEATSTEVPFTVNGETNPLFLEPAPEGTDCVICARTQSLGEIVTKGGKLNLAPAGEGNPPRIEWSITIPGKNLIDNGVQDINFTDSLTGEHEFRLGTAQEGFSNFRSSTRNSDGTLVTGTLVNYSTEPVISADGKQVSLTVKQPAGGWEADKKYQINYFTFFTNNIIPAAGTTFQNKFVVTGAEVLQDDAVVQINSGDGTASGQIRVSVAKTVEGLKAEDVALGAETEFTFNYICALPNGVTDDGQIIAKGDGQVVRAGETHPAGSTCEVTEVLPAPVIAGYEFVSATDTQTVKMISGENVANFVNTYREVPPVVEEPPVDEEVPPTPPVDNPPAEEEVPPTPPVDNPPAEEEVPPTPPVVEEPPAKVVVPPTKSTPKPKAPVVSAIRKELPRTGAEVTAVVVAALALLGTGAFLVLARRKKNKN